MFLLEILAPGWRSWLSEIRREKVQRDREGREMVCPCVNVLPRSSCAENLTPSSSSWHLVDGSLGATRVRKAEEWGLHDGIGGFVRGSADMTYHAWALSLCPALCCGLMQQDGPHQMWIQMVWTWKYIIPFFFNFSMVREIFITKSLKLKSHMALVYSIERKLMPKAA